jgi:hypothetical protein
MQEHRLVTVIVVVIFILPLSLPLPTMLLPFTGFTSSPSSWGDRDATPTPASTLVFVLGLDGLSPATARVLERELDGTEPRVGDLLREADLA